MNRRQARGLAAPPVPLGFRQFYSHKSPVFIITYLLQEGRTAPSNFPPRPFSGKQIALDHKLLQIDIDSEQISIQTSFNDNLPRKLRHPSFLKTMETSSGSGRKGWQFILNEFRDEGINVSGNVPMKSIELICDGQLDIHSTDSFFLLSLTCRGFMWL